VLGKRRRKVADKSEPHFPPLYKFSTSNQVGSFNYPTMSIIFGYRHKKDTSCALMEHQRETQGRQVQEGCCISLEDKGG
jgi:hypothetical protein